MLEDLDLKTTPKPLYKLAYISFMWTLHYSIKNPFLFSLETRIKPIKLFTNYKKELLAYFLSYFRVAIVSKLIVKSINGKPIQYKVDCNDNIYTEVYTYKLLT